MKTLNEFCNANNLQVIPIKYKGWTRKGYDIINVNKHILLSLEPCDYSNGEKWHVRNSHHNYDGPKYAKRITKKLLSFINPSETSFFRFA